MNRIDRISWYIQIALWFCPKIKKTEILKPNGLLPNGILPPDTVTYTFKKFRGRLYLVDEQWYYGPPDHPNCRCFIQEELEQR